MSGTSGSSSGNVGAVWLGIGIATLVIAALIGVAFMTGWRPGLVVPVTQVAGTSQGQLLTPATGTPEGLKTQAQSALSGLVSLDERTDVALAEVSSSYAALPRDGSIESVSPQQLTLNLNTTTNPAATTVTVPSVTPNGPPLPSGESGLVRNGGTLVLDRKDSGFEGGFDDIPVTSKNPSGAAYRCEGGAIKLRLTSGKQLSPEERGWLDTFSCPN